MENILIKLTFVCDCNCFLLPSQKSFSLVLEALDHDNDTSESGELGIDEFAAEESELYRLI